jgi:hypothetical protein
MPGGGESITRRDAPSQAAAPGIEPRVVEPKDRGRTLQISAMSVGSASLAAYSPREAALGSGFRAGFVLDSRVE